GLRPQGPQQLRALRRDLRSTTRGRRRPAHALTIARPRGPLRWVMWSSGVKPVAEYGRAKHDPQERPWEDQPCVGAARRFFASGLSSERNMPTMLSSFVASTGLTR